MNTQERIDLINEILEGLSTLADEDLDASDRVSVAHASSALQLMRNRTHRGALSQKVRTFSDSIIEDVDAQIKRLLDMGESS